MLEWNVFVEDVNSKKIKIHNIFNNYSFRENITKLLKKKLSKEEFAEKVKSKLMYYYWSKCEWEVVITSWPPRIDQKEIDKLKFESEEFNMKHGHHPYSLPFSPTVGEKVDVYDQVMMNWDKFIDYLWNTKTDKLNNK